MKRHRKLWNLDLCPQDYADSMEPKGVCTAHCFHAIHKKLNHAGLVFKYYGGIRQWYNVLVYLRKRNIELRRYAIKLKRGQRIHSLPGYYIASVNTEPDAEGTNHSVVCLKNHIYLDPRYADLVPRTRYVPKEIWYVKKLKPRKRSRDHTGLRRR